MNGKVYIERKYLIIAERAESVKRPVLASLEPGGGVRGREGGLGVALTQAIPVLIDAASWLSSGSLNIENHTSAIVHNFQ